MVRVAFFITLVAHIFLICAAIVVPEIAGGGVLLPWLCGIVIGSTMVSYCAGKPEPSRRKLAFVSVATRYVLIAGVIWILLGFESRQEIFLEKGIALYQEMPWLICGIVGFFFLMDFVTTRIGIFLGYRSTLNTARRNLGTRSPAISPNAKEQIITLDSQMAVANAAVLEMPSNAGGSNLRELRKARGG